MQGNDLEAKSREGEEDCSKYIVLCTCVCVYIYIYIYIYIYSALLRYN